MIVGGSFVVRILRDNAHETIKYKNSNSNDTFQRDATLWHKIKIPIKMMHFNGTPTQGRPVDNTQYYTNNEIGNDEKRCRPVGENQQQQMPQPNSKTKFTMIIIQYIFTSPSPPISPQTPSSSILVLAV
jgi:hypothetical protein